MLLTVGDIDTKIEIAGLISEFQAPMRDEIGCCEVVLGEWRHGAAAQENVANSR